MADSEVPDRNLLIPIPMYDSKFGWHHVLLPPDWLRDGRDYKRPRMEHDWDFSRDFDTDLYGNVVCYKRYRMMREGSVIPVWKPAYDDFPGTIPMDRYWIKRENGYVLSTRDESDDDTITKVTQDGVFYGPESKV